MVERLQLRSIPPCIEGAHQNQADDDTESTEDQLLGHVAHFATFSVVKYI